MAEQKGGGGESSGKNIVIKRITKKVAGGGHGGSWKVAYADFVTAMMAFFLLLWLLSMVEPEKKKHLAQMFREFTIFSNEGTGLLQRELPKSSDKQNFIRPKSAYLPQIPGGGNLDYTKVMPAPNPSPLTSVSLRKKLKKIIRIKMAAFKSNVLVTETEDGIRLEIMSLEDDPLFQLGGTELTFTMKKILKKLYKDILKLVDNKIVVEGHTDAIFYVEEQQSNWDLSVNRAIEVKKELVKLGFSSERLAMVAGYASTMPLIESDPKDPRNRRISILIIMPELKNLTKEAKKEIIPGDNSHIIQVK